VLADRRCNNDKRDLLPRSSARDRLGPPQPAPRRGTCRAGHGQPLGQRPSGNRGGCPVDLQPPAPRRYPAVARVQGGRQCWPSRSPSCPGLNDQRTQSTLPAVADHPTRGYERALSASTRLHIHAVRPARDCLVASDGLPAGAPGALLAAFHGRVRIVPAADRAVCPYGCGTYPVTRCANRPSTQQIRAEGHVPTGIWALQRHHAEENPGGGGGDWRLRLGARLPGASSVPGILSPAKITVKGAPCGRVAKGTAQRPRRT
jgi:hypothetical protein